MNMMKFFIATILVMIGISLMSDSLYAQTKKARSPKANTVDKKKVATGSSDTVLEERNISSRLETPRTKFVVDRMYPDVKVDFGRFGDLSEAIEGDAQRTLYRNKYEEKPEKISASDIVEKLK